MPVGAGGIGEWKPTFIAGDGVRTSAVPTRTHVDPSSMATSKSCDIPIDNCCSPYFSASCRRRTKYGREGSASSVHGGMVISPSSFRLRQSRTDETNSSSDIRIGPHLRLLGRQLHLQHYVDWFAFVVQPAREFNGIDGLNDLEKLGGAPGLIRLQVTDQMKPRSREI